VGFRYSRRTVRRWERRLGLVLVIGIAGPLVLGFLLIALQFFTGGSPLDGGGPLAGPEWQRVLDVLGAVPIVTIVTVFTIAGVFGGLAMRKWAAIPGGLFGLWLPGGTLLAIDGLVSGWLVVAGVLLLGAVLYLAGVQARVPIYLYRRQIGGSYLIAEGDDDDSWERAARPRWADLAERITAQLCHGERIDADIAEARDTLPPNGLLMMAATVPHLVSDALFLDERWPGSAAGGDGAAYLSLVRPRYLAAARSRAPEDAARRLCALAAAAQARGWDNRFWGPVEEAVARQLTSARRGATGATGEQSVAGQLTSSNRGTPGATGEQAVAGQLTSSIRGATDALVDQCLAEATILVNHFYDAIHQPHPYP
jgi:hypothetical protein